MNFSQDLRKRLNEDAHTSPDGGGSPSTDAWSQPSLAIASLSDVQTALLAATHQHPFIAPLAVQSFAASLNAAAMAAAVTAAANLNPLVFHSFLAPQLAALFASSPLPIAFPSNGAIPPTLAAIPPNPEVCALLSTVAAPPPALSPLFLSHLYATRAAAANGLGVPPQPPPQPLPPQSVSATVSPATQSSSPDETASQALLAPSDNSDQKQKMKWTPRMDELLLEAMNLYKAQRIGMWKKVAQYVSAHILYNNPSFVEINQCQLIVTNHQCGERYKHHLSPEVKERKTGSWTTEEIDELTRLVAEHEVKNDSDSVEGRGRSHISWVKISNSLNRNYRECQHKWAAISKPAMKRGTFSNEEEATIIESVAKNGENPSTWSDLEVKLGRKKRSIQDKYKYLKRKKS